MTDKEIYMWLADQKYQTIYDETGEYKMYFSVDMPMILRDFIEKQKEKQREEENNA